MTSNNEEFAPNLAAAADVSDKNDVEGLRESEAKYRGFIENLSVMFYAVEPRPPYAPIYISPTFEQFGYPLEQWRESSNLWVRAIHPDDREWVVRKTEAAMQAGAETDFEYRVIAKNGDVHWVRDSGSFIRDERGKVFYWQGIILDITEHKRAEELLKDSEARYRDLFENANDLIYIHDLKGDFLSVNKTTERVFGYTHEEALKMNMRQIFAVPEHLKIARRMLADKIAGARHTAYEIECLTKDGNRVRLEVNSRAIYQGGVPIAIQGIARDVTERRRHEQTLREREEQYRELFENANDLIYTHDLEGNFTSLNRAGEIITGYTREEALQMNIAEVVAPQQLAKAQQMIAQKVGGELPTAYELEIVNKTGKRVSLELSTRLILQNEKPVGVQGIGRDITERKHAEAALVESERRFRSLGEGIMHQVWTTDPNGNLDYVNERTLQYFGLTSEQIIGSGWQKVVHSDDLAGCLQRLRHSVATGADFKTEFRLRRHDGKYCWFQSRATAGFDDEGKIIQWFGTNTDIDDRKKAEAKLNHYAGHDTLTNLPNRARFMNYLARATLRAEHHSGYRCAVLFLDLDRFKVINDSLGHSIGDKLLIAIAERLDECVRPKDIVARLGGDEFTILLNGINGNADAVQVADRILEKLAAPFKLDAYEVFTSASIGVIVSDEISRSPEDFLRDADAAMYRAKATGKARYEIFDREMHIRNMNLLQMENDLRRAIEQNEFRVFYQPIVELASGAVREFEALIRWQHPQRGLVAPNEFIGIAEETGLIVPIGRWILEQACRQTVEWQRRFSAHQRLSICVNLSAKQLLHPNLMAQVSEILIETELDPHSLKLEVTESMVMENSEKSLAIIADLHALGTSISTDDFGTGYSSLSYLHRFPFNRLKIDRSFVGRMDTDAKSEAIVRTILLLGQNLNIETVAEGIETEAQLEGLRALGCRTGQGYLFSKPVDAARAAEILRDGLPEDFNRTSFSFGDGGKQRHALECDKVH